MRVAAAVAPLLAAPAARAKPCSVGGESPGPWSIYKPRHYCSGNLGLPPAGQTVAECADALVANPGCASPDNGGYLVYAPTMLGGQSSCSCVREHSLCNMVAQSSGTPDFATMDIYATSCSGSDPTAAPVSADAYGDPFTRRNGQKVQFFLPPRQETALVTCGNVTVRGRVMRSAAAGDTSQWFDRFVVAVAGADAVTVDAVDPRPAAAEGDEGESVADVRVAGGAPAELTTLRVTVAGRRVAHTGAARAAAAAVTVTVTQSLKAVGGGFAEAAEVTAGAVSVTVRSAAAAKLAEGSRRVHLDVAFGDGVGDRCAGVLPEIWGVVPLSEATAKLLVPAH